MNQHEEKAREIVVAMNKALEKELRKNEEYGVTDMAFLIPQVAEALASAEKKGREDGRQETKVLSDEFYQDGWNEAIDEAVNVAMSLEDEFTDCKCQEIIAEQIKKLRKQ